MAVSTKGGPKLRKDKKRIMNPKAIPLSQLKPVYPKPNKPKKVKRPKMQ